MLELRLESFGLMYGMVMQVEYSVTQMECREGTPRERARAARSGGRVEEWEGGEEIGRDSDSELERNAKRAEWEERGKRDRRRRREEKEEIRRTRKREKRSTQRGEDKHLVELH